MEHFIITISRAYGSGGSIIGKCIAEKLGIACYDRNYIDRTAHERGLDKTYIPDWKEDISSLGIWGADNASATILNLNYWKSGSPYYSNEKDICEEWSFSKQTVNSTVRGLVEKCYVYLERAPDSRKRKIVKLTDAGKAFIQDDFLFMHRAEEKALMRMTGEETDLYMQSKNQTDTVSGV